MPKQLRALFVTISVHNAPPNPAALWNLHIIEGGHPPVPLYTYLAHNFYHSRNNLHNYSDVNEGGIAIAYHTVDDIICDITKNEKNIENLSLCTPAPERPPIMGADGVLKQNLQSELQYDCTAQLLQYETHSKLFNDEQRNLFQTIIRYFEQYQLNIGPANTVSPISFIDAPGGTGKFFFNTISAYLRAKGN